MKNKLQAIAVFALSAIAISLYSSQILAQTTPATPPAPPTANVGITAVHLVRTENNTMPENFNMDLRMFYIAPGGYTTTHWHPGPLTLLVLEGELTYSENGVEKTYKTGESWTEPVGEKAVHQLLNKGKAMAKFVLVGLTPKGSTFTNTVQQ